MSDPEVPERDNQPADVNEVVESANESLAEAEAAANSSAAPAGESSDAAAPAAAPEPAPAAETEAPGVPAPASDAPLAVEEAGDPVLAAFEAAEREHPGTFSDMPAPAPAVSDAAPAQEAETAAAASDVASVDPEPAPAPAEPAPVAEAPAAAPAPAYDEAPPAYAPPVEPEADTTAYAAGAAAGAAAATQVYPSEPTYAAAPEPAPQPIFVQAPEPPRPIGNRAMSGLIGLIAAVVFAVLYLAAKLGIGMFRGDVTLENVGAEALAQVQSWGLWLPVAAFFIGFWLLGAIINRGRWGAWVIFGLIVGLFAYGGHIAGVLFDAPFWMQTATQVRELVVGELFAPLAIAAFVLGREITIWFGAWAARSGARKNELNAEAQREYERTLEAGPTLSR